MIKRVILLTSSFPYGQGEQFLETEMKYYNNIDLTILPKIKSEKVRAISTEIKVDDFIANHSFKSSKFIYLFKSLGDKTFYKELSLSNFFNIKKIKFFFSSIYLYEMYYELFTEYFSQLEDIENVVIYTYWHDEATYALQSLKQKYNYKIVSRIHRGDLYQEEKSFSYMPLKKQFTDNLDTLYTITESANSYLEKTYGFKKRVLKVSRLGVEDRKIVSKKSLNSSLYILSCSFLTEVKQVDKLIVSIKKLSQKNRRLKIVWRHIGDGVLLNKLSALAKREFEGIDNIEYEFLGSYENWEVYEYYKNNPIDVFVNTSLSEGVPVSIMEAMSCHIPIIAPNVGGVSDMVVNEYNGYLLSKECQVQEIVDALSRSDFFKQDKIRKNSYNLFLEKYNAEKNYKIFVEDIVI